MNQNEAVSIGRMVLGPGMARKAADSMRLQPIWKQQILSGETDLDFDQWMPQYLSQQHGGTKLRDLVQPEMKASY